MKNKLIIILISFILLFALSASASAKEDSAITKDETIYIDLNSDGSVKEVLVVNHISTPVSGKYVDYGDYSSIENITGKEIPTVKDNKIIWDLPKYKDGFYYIGTMKKSELPWTFRISYYLENKIVDASKLGGITGNVKIKVLVTPNQVANKYFKENFAMQLSQSLNTDMCKNITAQDATTVVAGKNQTISFTVLPGADVNANISFEATDLELSGLSIILSPFSISEMGNMDHLKGGVKEMINAMDALISGTQQLKTGMVGVTSGVGELNSGAQSLVGANEYIEDGFNQYQQGLNTFGNYISSFGAEMSKSMDLLEEAGKKLETAKSALSQSTKKIDEALSGIDKNIGASQGQITQLETGLNQLSGGLDGLSTAMTDIMTTNTNLGAQLKGILTKYNSIQQQYVTLSSQLDGAMSTSATENAKNLQTNSDPNVQALADAYLNAGNTISTVKSGLSTANSSFTTLNSNFSGSIDDIGSGYTALNTGITQMKSSVDTMLQGLSHGFDFSGIKGQLTTLQKEMKNAEGVLGQFSMGDFNMDVNQYKDGMSQMNTAVTGLEDNFAKLKDGVTNNMFKGIEQLNQGLSLLYSNVSTLPAYVDKINNGQTQVRDGMNKAFGEYLGDETKPAPQSFASPGNLVPHTIQFIGTTPTIALDKTVYVAPEEVKTTLWGRIKTMFN